MINKYRKEMLIPVITLVFIQACACKPTLTTQEELVCYKNSEEIYRETLGHVINMPIKFYDGWYMPLNNTGITVKLDGCSIEKGR